MAHEQTDRPTDGIEGQLDAGLAGEDHLGDDSATELQTGSAMRTDPDDTREAMREATERSSKPAEG